VSPETVARALARRDRADRGAKLQRKAAPYWLILPSVLFLGAIVFYPLVVGLAEGFRNHNRLQPWLIRFNGIENYIQAFGDREVILALRTSMVMVVGIVGLSYLLGLVGALILDREFRGRGIYRALILVPWVIPPVVALAGPPPVRTNGRPKSLKVQMACRSVPMTLIGRMSGKVM
jgi:multiple sugar transport system permease protein